MIPPLSSQSNKPAALWKGLQRLDDLADMFRIMLEMAKPSAFRPDVSGLMCKAQDKQKPRLLENVGVARALGVLRREMTAAAIADREERQAWWKAVMRGEPDDDGNRPTISERLRASEILGRAQMEALTSRSSAFRLTQ